MSRGSLVIVPCGRSKIWDSQPKRGLTPASEAYTGTPFKLNRQYAERFSDRWVVLSAKYGFIAPEFEIPENYDVAFKHKKSNPIDIPALRRQVEVMRLHDYERIVGLGGAEYRKAIADAFAPYSVPVVFPFEGLPIGKMMQATKRAIETCQPRFDRESGR